MTTSSAFIRTLFILLSLIFMISYAVSKAPEPTLSTYALGTLLGVAYGGVLISLDSLFKRFSFRSFNIVILGLFAGYLLSLALVLIFNAILTISGLEQNNSFIVAAKIFLFLFGPYCGVMMTSRAADEISISIPFVKFTPTAQQTKEILIDLSALADPRLIDLAASGLLDKRLLFPRFLLKELQRQEEDPDEAIVSRAKRSLEVLKRIEAMPSLQMRYQDRDFPEAKESFAKILLLARLLDADLLSSDPNRIQSPATEGVRIINLQSLSAALKPLMQKGEFLKVKILRTGKEEMQGVGYLEDGTMIVVNGGGVHIGQTILTKVLSVKHTTSGRMIFCNVADGSEGDDAREID